ncbi:MAG: hypothetical protein M0P52_13435 [Rhodoferax sp.]|uniref:hypothetical protein n=1 Tax=Rhodoferax sp. TaxID=50421 RepID=UPI003BB5F53F|nr:hypothetical protein [Rhodoferax sp.]
MVSFSLKFHAFYRFPANMLYQNLVTTNAELKKVSMAVSFRVNLVAGEKQA